MQFINKKNIRWVLTKNLGNLNFAIFILFLIIIFSILGSIIEQDQSLAYYQRTYPIQLSNKLLINWQFIINLGLDHLYQTWWFLVTLIIFCLSLIVCTFSTQLPSLRNARRWKFIHQTQQNDSSTSINLSYIKKQSLINIIYSLSIKNYYIFHKQSNVYSYKGLIGRIAPVFVHISLILTLFGSTLGLFGGFVAQEMVPKNEIFHIKNVMKAGFYNQLPFDFIGRIDDFYIEYNFDNSIKQFFSEISIFNNKGNFILKDILSVNSPFIFKGVTFYQTDWQINALRVQISKDIVIQQKLNKIQLNGNTFWTCSLPVSNNDNIFIIIFNLDNQIFIYNSFGQIIDTVNINQKVKIENSSFIIKEIMMSTGLQIKMDPGIIFVYFGFAILILSTFMSYISYSQIWINIDNSKFILFGFTNRAMLSFEEEFTMIQKHYIENTF